MIQTETGNPPQQGEAAAPQSFDAAKRGSGGRNLRVFLTTPSGMTQSQVVFDMDGKSVQT
jgi:hypothetical protein